MARKRFKCSKCSRTFSMPAHLGRHVNTIHGKKTTKRVTRKKKPTAKVTGRVGRPKGVAASRTMAATPASLLARMRAYHRDLSARRAGLEAQIAAIGSALPQLEAFAAHPVKGSAAKAGRPADGRVQPGSFKDVIVRVLRQRSGPMKPKEIAIAVKRAGYKSKTKDLAHAVTKMLPTMKSVKKVGFGLYRG